MRHPSASIATLGLVSLVAAVTFVAPASAAPSTEPAEVELLGGRVTSDGSVALRILVRCQEPWIVQELVVEVSQGSLVGSTAGDFGIVCDGRRHLETITVAPSLGTFVGGTAHADAFFTVLDPESFDPVDQAQDSETIMVSGRIPRATTLVDQTGSRVGARISTDSIADTLDSQGADDFVVPSGEQWSIETIVVEGVGGVTSALPPAVTVFFYQDAGAVPGDTITIQAGLIPTGPSACDDPCDLTIALSPAVTLPAGTYWVSVQADMSSLPEGASWLWSFRGVSAGDPGVWQQPLGAAPTWDTEFDHDFAFKLIGTTTPV